MNTLSSIKPPLRQCSRPMRCIQLLQPSTLGLRVLSHHQHLRRPSLGSTARFPWSPASAPAAASPEVPQEMVMLFKAMATALAPDSKSDDKELRDLSSDEVKGLLETPGSDLAPGVLTLWLPQWEGSAAVHYPDV